MALLAFEAHLIKLAERGKLESCKNEASTGLFSIKISGSSGFGSGFSLSVCVVVVGGLSAGAIPDVAMIRERGRLTLTLTTIWHCVFSSMVSNGACGAEKRAGKMSVLGR